MTPTAHTAKRLDETWRAEPSSLVDPVGQVFHYEGRVLRGIRPAYVDQTRRILARARKDDWFSHGLVRTWETDLATEEFPLVLEHQRVPFVTLRAEWSAEGLRRAARCHLDLSAKVLASGFALKDAHTWNLLFDGTTPIFTDFGSVRPFAEINWAAWVREFCKYFVAPLALFSRGQSSLARAALREHIPGVGNWFIDNAPGDLMRGAESMFAVSSTVPEVTLARLRESIEALVFPHEKSEWTGYAQPLGQAPAPALRDKDRIVASALDRLRFGSVIDVGANRGLHARMCADRGAQVLACDIDETCIDAMFLDAERRQAPILPLYLDVVWPLGPSGAFESIPSAQQRLQCDLVISLALVHHVCMRWQFTPASFARGIAAFTRDKAIIEFIPADDWHVAQWGLPAPPGYTSAGMQDALSRLFRCVDRVVSDPSPRELFICDGKR